MNSIIIVKKFFKIYKFKGMGGFLRCFVVFVLSFDIWIVDIENYMLVVRFFGVEKNMFVIIKWECW